MTRPVLVALSLVLLMLGEAAGEGLADRRVPGGGLIVVDAGGQVVGSVFGGFLGLPITTVRLRVDDRDLLVGVGSARIFGFPPIRYEMAGCTGPGYLELALPPGLAPLFLEVAAVDSAGALLAPEGSEVTTTILSEWNAFPTPSCDPVPGDVVDARPAVVVGTVTGFTPPFRLEVAQ